MGEETFFQEALSNFTNEIAYGDAVKRLADEGLSVAQIIEKIDYPAPINRVQKMVFERLCEIGVIFLDFPDGNSYISRTISKSNKEKFLKEIFTLCKKNSDDNSFIKLKIDLQDKNTDKILSCLDRRQKEYIEGIFFENKIVYHKLNLRMREILFNLCECKEFSASCYFTISKECLLF